LFAVTTISATLVSEVDADAVGAVAWAKAAEPLHSAAQETAAFNITQANWRLDIIILPLILAG